MANKPVIAVDIDDVIAAHAPAFITYTNQKWSTNLTLDDYQEHWSELWKVNQRELQRRSDEYHNSGYIGTYSIIEGASAALARLKNKYRLIIITSRRQSVDKLTMDWIERYYPHTFDDVHFAGFWDKMGNNRIELTKGKLAKELGADYLIDDQLKHCVAAAEVGINSLLFGNYPWNQADDLPESITRVSNWQSVMEYFDGRDN